MSSNPQVVATQSFEEGTAPLSDERIAEIASSRNAVKVSENSLRNLRVFQPGNLVNPGGRPKRDLAADIALQAFAKDPDVLAEAFHKALRKANPKVFKELADRAFGKVPLNVNMDVTVNIGDRLEAARRRREQRMQLASNNVTEQSAGPGELGAGGGGGSTPESE